MINGTPIYDVIGMALVGEPGIPITISFTDTSAQSSVLTAGQLYMFQSDQLCHVAFGDDPTATTANTPIAANVPYPFTPLEDKMVAAIRGGDDSGTLWITPMTRYQ